MATIRKRGNSYQIRVSCGYDVIGNQVTQTMSRKPETNMTKKQIEKEVNRQAVLFEEACMKGQVVSSVKFETFAEQWFDEYAKHNLKNTSLDRMSRLRDKIYPEIGHIRFDRITARHIQNFINKLADAPNERTKKPLARKTIVHNLSFISCVFDYAVKMGMITDNPCRRVNVPKGEKFERPIYTIEETQQLLKLLKEKAPLKYYVFYVLYSGFRRGEMLGLEWKDINYDNNIISVRRTSNYTPEKGIYTDTTKTKRSQRSIKLPQFVMNLLKDYQAEQNDEKERLGDKWEDYDRLFTQWNGKPMNPHTAGYWLRDFCKENNFRFCDTHSFRHLNASLLINAGIDVTSVSAALGHSQTSTTLNIYSHHFLEVQAKNSEAIATAINFTP